jgi:catechol 2,3-dioxygenase-like lactoylglutathione lyase family enzyme
MISRRQFLALTGAASLVPPSLWAAEEFPSLLDHIILGCNDLDRGIAFVEERTGVRAMLGGVHPGRGTANALLSFGERHYLEIMAPDPKATAVQPSALQQVTVLKGLTSPRLMTWAAHPGDIDALAKKLRESGIATLGPSPGSRKRPDGRVLSWKSLSLADDHHGLLPFFIEWRANSVHPSSDAPPGCHIEHFAAAEQDPVELSKIFQRIGIDALVERGEKPQLRVRISGPKGTLEMTS